MRILGGKDAQENFMNIPQKLIFGNILIVGVRLFRSRQADGENEGDGGRRNRGGVLRGRARRLTNRRTCAH